MNRALLFLFVAINSATLKDAITFVDPDRHYVFSYEATQALVKSTELEGEPEDIVIALAQKSHFKITKWHDSYYVSPKVSY